MSVTIKGGDVLARRLRALDAKVARAALQGALEAGAVIVRDDARRRVPRRTGTLADNIDTETTAKGTKGVAKIGYAPVAFYGKFLELGTRYMGARPHLRPALDANQGRAVAAVADHLRRAVDAAARS